MIKLGVVDVEQSANYGEIYLSLAADHVDDALVVLTETYEARVPLVHAGEEEANDAGR
jgi:chromatin segregation and condensation protein Rec8/ScpA/Scc1 (kleisin family)